MSAIRACLLLAALLIGCGPKNSVDCGSGRSCAIGTSCGETNCIRPPDLPANKPGLNLGTTGKESGFSLLRFGGLLLIGLVAYLGSLAKRDMPRPAQFLAGFAAPILGGLVLHWTGLSNDLTLYEFAAALPWGGALVFSIIYRFVES